jgi:hypothetical protein
MKFFLMLTLLVLFAAIFSVGQVPVKTTNDLVKELDAKLTAALLRGESATVDAILADDYTETNAQGLVRNKAEVMATVRAVASAPGSISLGPKISVDETNLYSYENTAILTTLTTTRYQFMVNQELPQAVPDRTQTATDRERLMRVYSKFRGRWQLVASQATSVAKR